MISKTVLFSALKLSMEPNESARVIRWNKMVNEANKYLPVVADVVNEPMYIDDIYKSLTPAEQLQRLLWTGELLISLVGEQADKMVVVGFATLSDLVVGRSATLGGWVSPAFRSKSLSVQKMIRKFIREDILTYAFNTLGLQKLKCEMSVHNRPAVRFAHNLGFRGIGILQSEVYFNGIAHDTLMAELLNPQFFSPVEELISEHGIETATSKQQSVSIDGADARTARTADEFASSVSAGDATDTNGATSVDIASSDRPSVGNSGNNGTKRRRTRRSKGDIGQSAVRERRSK